MLFRFFLFFFFFSFFLFSNSYSQDRYWMVDASTGFGKGIKPYGSSEYYSNKPALNTFQVGVKRVVSSTLGLRLSFSYDQFSNSYYNYYYYKIDQYKMTVEGVADIFKLLDIELDGDKYNLLVHAGVHLSFRTPRSRFSEAENNNLVNKNINVTDHDGGIIYGFSPQFKMDEKIYLFADVSFLSNYRQHLNWDGSTSSLQNDLYGKMYSISIGFSYKLNTK